MGGGRGRGELQIFQTTFLKISIGFNNKYQGGKGVHLYNGKKNVITENIDKVHHIPKI